MYEHTQRGTPIVLLCGISGLVALALAALNPGGAMPGAGRVITAVAGVVLLLSGLSFSSLTIRVAGGSLSWFFGARLLRKAVPLSEIVDVTPTTTSFLDGWGIHRTFRGWLYNVRGRRALLITRRDGRRFLLGTDEPEALAAAIRAGSGPAA